GPASGVLCSHAWGNANHSVHGCCHGDRMVAGLGARRSKLHLPCQRAEIRDRRNCLHPRPTIAMPDEFEQSVVATDQQNLSPGAVDSASFPLRSLIAAFILAVSLLVQLNVANAGTPKAGAFDYYALTLSWSPTYCAGSGNNFDSPQCDVGRRFAFVVHG